VILYRLPRCVTCPLVVNVFVTSLTCIRYEAFRATASRCGSVNMATLPFTSAALQVMCGLLQRITRLASSSSVRRRIESKSKPLSTFRNTPHCGQSSNERQGNLIASASPYEEKSLSFTESRAYGATREHVELRYGLPCGEWREGKSG